MAAIYTIAPPDRRYIIQFSSPMPDGNYILQVSTGQCTAAGGACPGFGIDYTQLARTSSYMVIRFRRNDNGYTSYVASMSFTVYKDSSRTSFISMYKV